MLEYLSVWVWGKREQEVMKFKILLTSFWLGRVGLLMELEVKTLFKQ